MKEDETPITDHFKALATSRIKRDHFKILATGRSDMHCKIKDSLSMI